MGVGLGEEDAEIGVGEFHVEDPVGDLDDRIVPPGDALLLVESAGDALVESVLEKRALDLVGGVVSRPAGIGDDGEQEQAEEGDGDADRSREAAKVSAEMLSDIEWRHENPGIELSLASNTRLGAATGNPCTHKHLSWPSQFH